MSATRTLLSIAALIGFVIVPVQAEAQKEKFVRSKPHVNFGRSHPDFIWLPTNVNRAAKRQGPRSAIRGSRRPQPD